MTHTGIIVKGTLALETVLRDVRWEEGFDLFHSSTVNQFCMVILYKIILQSVELSVAFHTLLAPPALAPFGLFCGRLLLFSRLL